jgi:hypothetical protein
MKLVILITAQTERSLEIANAWKQANASGVTVLEGYGLYRLQEKFGIRDDMPLIPSLSSLLSRQEEDTHLLISMVDDATAEKLHQVTVNILGDLTIPGNGVLAILEIAQIFGLRS